MYLEILGYITLSINILSIAVITIGVITSVVKTVHGELMYKSAQEKMLNRQAIRAYLGSYILLGLELLIASDIIGTIAHPSTEEMIILAVTVLIRTFISYFLNMEIEAVARNMAENKLVEK